MYKLLPILLFAYGLAVTTEDIYDNSWALVVGINEYQNAPDLSYAVEDALAIKNMLINQYGFPRKNVFYLADDDATQQNIKKQMYNITNAAGKNDRVIFYFAGHGETKPLGLEEGDAGFLMPSDGDANKLYLTAIPMDELQMLSKYSKAKHMLFLVDACYGGLAAMNARSIKTITPNYLDKIKQDNVRQIITAGGKDEEVMEKDDWQHSAFTKNLLSGLRDKKADSDEDGYIIGSELGLYLQKRVSIDTDNSQTPQDKRFTTHDGEIIFHSKVDENDEEDLNAQEMFDKFLEKLDQKYQNNQFQIDENQRVVKPGSMGLYKVNPTQEVKIIRVFYQPSGGLMYEVKFKLSIGADDEWTQSAIIKIDDVLEIPGVTKYGIFNLSTGTID